MFDTEDEDILNDPEVFRDLVEYDVTSEAIRAYDAGEIDLWIAYNRPKSMEEWGAWEAEHGDLSGRWKA